MPKKARGPYLKFLAKRGVYYIHWTRGDGSQGTRSTGTAEPAKAEAEFRRFMREDYAGVAIRSRPEPTGYVYFIGGDVGAIKIGFSADPARRLAQLQCGSPIPLRILAAGKGCQTSEYVYQNVQFHRHRLHGEWFDRAPEIVAEIERINAQNGR